MPILHLAVLAIVQGITEFLPISSSGHLALIPFITGWKDQGLMMDVAVHVGTLGAVVIYLWRDIGSIIGGVMGVFSGRNRRGAQLFGLMIVGSIPIAIVGYFMNLYYPNGIRSVEIIAWTTLGFGILLLVVDKVCMTVKRIEHLHVSDAVVIGLSQVLALIPGTSRSGITMTAARLIGMERSDAARFSLLLSIPAIIGAGALQGHRLYLSGNMEMTMDVGVVTGLAFITALITIALLMSWLRRASFTPFALYRILLGVGLLYVSYGLA